MLSRLRQLWQGRRDDVRILYVVVLMKTAGVVLLLFLLWALREKDAVVAYMRF